MLSECKVSSSFWQASIPITVHLHSFCMTAKIALKIICLHSECIQNAKLAVHFGKGRHRVLTLTGYNVAESAILGSAKAET